MNDLLTSCPRCDLMGNHHVQRIPARPNPRAGEHVADIMAADRPDPVRTIVEPAEFPAFLRRLCVFCGHEWREADQ